jgi:hypothetical protein
VVDDTLAMSFQIPPFGDKGRDGRSPFRDHTERSRTRTRTGDSKKPGALRRSQEGSDRRCSGLVGEVSVGGVECYGMAGMD